MSDISFRDIRTIANRFVIIERLASEIYLAKDQKQNDLLVAMKLERSDARRSLLEIEKSVFQIMSKCVYVPRMFYFGVDHEYTILAMDYLGPSIEDLFTFCERKFFPKTIAMIMEQVLRAIEAFHNRSLLHRDIKPDNFLFGRGARSHIIHLIDFGLCKHYRHPLTYEHIPYRHGKFLLGTARYSSLSTHHGLEQSRRDDIQSLAYAMIYLAKGYLPWMSVNHSNRTKGNEKLVEMKESLTARELCADLPEEFELIYRYSRTLSYTQRPDYGYLRSLFLAVINRSKGKFDHIYDWHILVKMFKENLDAGRAILSTKKS